jgi:glycosyltransferase involved in cell wall biosynthesis
MKKVLFLAYLFPPIANSGTQRPLKFVKFLAENGWEPIVLTAAETAAHPTDTRLLDEIPRGTRVIRVPMLGEWLARSITGALGGGALATRIGAGVEWRVRNRRRSPDLYASWQPMAERAALRAYRDIGFDAVFATGYPWTSMITARAIAARTGRPLVVDFRDLWSGETMLRDERPPHDEEKRLEHAVLSAADAVVTTSDTMTRWFMNAYPSEDASKFVTIHNGYDAADMGAPPSPRDDERFRIVYTGVWKADYNPAALYDALDWIRRSNPQLLDGVRLVTAGYTPGEARRRKLDFCIKELGFVPHADAVGLMKSADLLFLTHADPTRQTSIPGKLYEYLATGAPVLAVTDPEKETGRILRRVGGGIAISPEDPGLLYASLIDALSGTLQMPPGDVGALRGFDRRQLAARLAGVLDQVSKRAPVTLPARGWNRPAATPLKLRPR